MHPFPFEEAGWVSASVGGWVAWRKRVLGQEDDNLLQLAPTEWADNLTSAVCTDGSGAESRLITATQVAASPPIDSGQDNSDPLLKGQSSQWTASHYHIQLWCYFLQLSWLFLFCVRVLGISAGYSLRFIVIHIYTVIIYWTFSRRCHLVFGQTIFLLPLNKQVALI